ncbi:hypothetical protein [Paenibacillus lutrae]|nr:hypothetical protein [Paenibacillus lutrae]
MDSWSALTALLRKSGKRSMFVASAKKKRAAVRPPSLLFDNT